MDFDKNTVLSVREFNAVARQVIESGLPLVWVSGEISNFVAAASGHWYFSLKDAQAQVRCVMFRNKSLYLDFKPQNGMQIEVLALPSFYEARGDFQLILEKMRPAGLGALYAAFEQLKTKLQREGLFEETRKKSLPFLPRQLGIVTSLQAAALRDVLRTLAKRMLAVPVIVYPVPVQGNDAAPRIAAAIREANERGECDTLIVCRGGGSIEDLWAFNEEIVARAIAHSQIPIISGVGHETDFTIADFVADLRAATPTAAAQAAVPDSAALSTRLQHSAAGMARSMLRRFGQYMQQLDYLQRRLLHPAQRIQQQRTRLEQLQQRLQTAHSHTLQRYQWQCRDLWQRLRAHAPDVAGLQQQHVSRAQHLLEGMRRNLMQQHSRLTTLQQHLQHLDPAQVMARGYSMVRDEDGGIVLDSAQLALGAKLKLTFARGWASAEVLEKDEH